ncbi:MAG TPA: preprotein translocase subunit SecG [Methylomirabilota bacterium]|jgi:preprotein translocase subunit SecG|nr:preprotein translocase subunit SecG [Methylomirabilota bacterium]
MWYTIVTVIHIITCFFLATVVLLQQGKGSDVSAVFGGSSQTLFGSSGAGNLLTKLTSASAIIFMLTSLTLTYGAAKQSAKSLFDNAPVSTPAPPATPEGAPAAQSGAPTASSEATASSTTATTTTQPSASTEGQQTTSGTVASTPTTPATTVPTSVQSPTPTPAPSTASSGSAAK